MGNLSTKQTALLSELLSGTTITEACKKVGICRTTAYRYLENPTFKKAFQEEKNKMLEVVGFRMQIGMNSAIDELIKIITKKNTSDQVRVNAIDCLLRHSLPLMEDIEIMSRIESLERKQEEYEENTA